MWINSPPGPARSLGDRAVSRRRSRATAPGITFYRALLERTDEATLVVDATARIVYANRAATDLTGYRPDRLRGLALRELLVAGPQAAPLSRESLLDWLRASDEAAARAFVGRTCDGTRIGLGVRCRRTNFGRRKFYVLTLCGASRTGDAASEKFLRSVIDTAGDAIVAADARQIVTVFNPAAERIFGYAAGEVLGRRLECLMPARFRAAHAGHMREFATAARPARMMGERSEIVALRKDGTEFPAEASISRFVHDEEATFVVVLRDVSALRGLQRESLERARLFRAIFDQTFEFIAILRSDGTVEQANRTALDFAGLTREDTAGRPFWDCGWWTGATSEVDRLRMAVAEAAAGHFVRYEAQVCGAGGERRTIDFSLNPVADGSGAVVALVAEGCDISERVSAGEALRQSEARLANAQRIAKLGNWDWDVTTGALAWSEEIYDIFGLHKSTFGATYDAFLKSVHPDDRAYVEAAVRDAVELGRDYNLDHRIVRPDGTVRTVHEQGEVTRDAAGRPVRMTGIVQDVTERKDIERRLNEAKLAAEAANRAKSEFLANMSHELRTPLNAIIGFSEVMVRELYGKVQPDRYKDYCQQIFDSGQHLLGLINGILDMSKIEAGKMLMEESCVNLSLLLRSCRKLFADRAQQAGLTLDCVCDAPLPALYADPRMLKQMLFNLLSNAVKFTPSGGRITMRAQRAENGGLTLAVSDTGPGIAASDIPKALEPFGQLDGSLSRKFGGTGLGLSITKSLAELHQGQLRMESRLGAGTTVAVSFPPVRVKRS